jgi:hypothetical protein
MIYVDVIDLLDFNIVPKGPSKLHSVQGVRCMHQMYDWSFVDRHATLEPSRGLMRILCVDEIPFDL